MRGRDTNQTAQNKTSDRHSLVLTPDTSLTLMSRWSDIIINMPTGKKAAGMVTANLDQDTAKSLIDWGQ